MLSRGLLFVLMFFVCLFFSVIFSIVITSLGEERAGLCASPAFVCLFCTRQFVFFFSYSWFQGLAAACDCGTPWTFLLHVAVLRETCCKPTQT